MDNESAEVDLTPMLDMVFIMLIFFIVTATFVKEIGIELPGQSAKQYSASPEEAIVVEITEANKYYLNAKQVDPRALEHHLARLHAQEPNRQLVIKPSIYSNTDSLVYAMDAGRLVGLSVAVAEI
jgi:biopolymer transport protein ExbD